MAGAWKRVEGPLARNCLASPASRRPQPGRESTCLAFRGPAPFLHLLAIPGYLAVFMDGTLLSGLGFCPQILE